MVGRPEDRSASEDASDPVRQAALRDIPAVRRREHWVYVIALGLIMYVSALVVAEILTVGNDGFPTAALAVMAVCIVVLVNSMVVKGRATRRLEQDMTSPAREKVSLEVRVVVMDMPSGAGGVWWTRVSLCEPGTRRAVLISRIRGRGPAEVDGEPVTLHGRFVPGGNAVLEWADGDLFALPEPLRSPVFRPSRWRRFRESRGLPPHS